MGGGLGGGGSAAIQVSRWNNSRFVIESSSQAAVLLPVNVCCAKRRNIWLFSKLEAEPLKLEHRQFRSRVNPCRDRLIRSITCLCKRASSAMDKSSLISTNSSLH